MQLASTGFCVPIRQTGTCTGADKPALWSGICLRPQMAGHNLSDNIG